MFAFVHNGIIVTWKIGVGYIARVALSIPRETDQRELKSLRKGVGRDGPGQRSPSATLA